MSKGKNQAASRPLPESQDGATSNGTSGDCMLCVCMRNDRDCLNMIVGPGLARPRTGR